MAHNQQSILHVLVMEHSEYRLNVDEYIHRIDSPLDFNIPKERIEFDELYFMQIEYRIKVHLYHPPRRNYHRKKDVYQ
jgi:hypothetical protein